MSRTLTTQDVSWFLDLKERDQLNLDPPYQRRSVWSPRDKRFFIDTILNNLSSSAYLSPQDHQRTWSLHIPRS